MGLPNRDTTLVIDLRLSPAPAIAPDESLPTAIRRISVDLLDGAIHDLQPAHERDLDEGIHGARKKLKRTRGILRLVRDEIGATTYRNENAVLRDTGRTIGAMRDAWVLIATVRAIRARYADLLDPHTFSDTEDWLVDRYEELRARTGPQARTDAIVNLAAARSRFAAYPLDDVVGNDFDAIAPGIRRVYHRGLRGYRRASKQRSVEALHEWRKRVKYLRYQMEALAPIQPRFIGAIAGELEDLGELLGDDHDLAVLAETVLGNPEACPDDRERWMLMSLIYADREHLQATMFRRGAAAYAEKPSEFLDRVAAYWSASRG